MRMLQRISSLGICGRSGQRCAVFRAQRGWYPQAEQFGDPVYNNDNVGPADGSGTLMDGCLTHGEQYHYHAY